MSNVSKSVLVIGGAGYIGSHIVRRLISSKRKVVVVDSLSGASVHCSPAVSIYAGDQFCPELLDRVISKHRVDTVIHVASSHPCFRSPSSDDGSANRSVPMASLIDGAVKLGVSKWVFTSTCAVYAPSSTGQLVAESNLAAPLSMYGEDKLAVEDHLLGLSKRGQMRCVVLRCFNVAGAYCGDGFLGSGGDPSRLVNTLCQVATGRRDHVCVFGADFPTVDGTCVRDYVHVDDVALAHVEAVSYLDTGGASAVLNCGSGRGHSVLEVAKAVAHASGVAVSTRLLARRRNDVPSMVADNQRIRKTLGWAPRADALECIVRSALAVARANSA